MFANFRVIRIVSVIAVACCLLGTGCGKKKVRPKSWGAEVSGRVTLNGEPLKGGTVSFIPLTPEEQGGRPGVARLSPNGEYRVGNANPTKPSGLIPGKYRVTFLSMEVGKDPKQKVARLTIPESLTDSVASPLQCEVKRGEITLDFELSDEITKVAFHKR